MSRRGFVGSIWTSGIAKLCGGTIGVAVLLAALPAAGTGLRSPADFEFTCLVVDQFGQDKDEFQGGETAVLGLRLIVPEDVYDDQIDVKVFAEIKVSGFKYRVKLPILDVDVPERPERLSIDGYTPDLQEFIPFRQLDTFDDVTEVAFLPVKLPKNVPNTKFFVKAIASVKGHGSQSCKQKVRLVR